MDFFFSTALSTNFQLEKENQKLSADLSKYREESIKTAKANSLYKVDLDSLSNDRDSMYESHQKQKLLLNELSVVIVMVFNI